MGYRNPCWPKDLAVAAMLLIEAANCAKSLGVSQWAFAVELCEFRNAGISLAALRYLARLGFVDYARAIPGAQRDERSFQEMCNATFDDRTCFVLTALGRAVLTGGSFDPALQSRSDWSEGTFARCMVGLPLQSLPTATNLKPSWDADMNRLMFGQVVVKEYRNPAENQRLILTVFEEEGWVRRIDDPLPPKPGVCPKKRLHQTIGALNRSRKNPIIRFAGDGTGRAVLWLMDIPMPPLEPE